MLTTRSPSGPRITILALAAVQTADRSSAASAWQSEPPIVPRLRTTGSAITCSASRKSGKCSASSADLEQVDVAGERADADLALLLANVGELVQIVDVDQVLGVREPQLHHRQQAVPACDDARLGPEALQRRDHALHARGTLILERCGSLHHVLLSRKRTALERADVHEGHVQPALRLPRRRGSGQPLARRTDVVALLVLDGRVRTDHRRARQLLGARVTDVGVEGARSATAALDVAEHAPAGLAWAIGASRPRRARVSVPLV